MKADSVLRDESHSVLTKALQGHAPDVGHNWHTLSQAMIEVTESYSTKGEALLRHVIRFEGEIPLSDVSPIPHAMSPTDALKSHAIQTLGRWNKITREDVVRFEALEPSDSLMAVAKAQPIVDDTSGE